MSEVICEECGCEIEDWIEPEYMNGFGPFCDGDCAQKYIDEMDGEE